MQVKEVGSGAVDRESSQQLINAARRREIDVVLVWKLDRWGRSLADLVATLQELTDLNVAFVSLTEALDLTTSTGRAMPACFQSLPPSNTISRANAFVLIWITLARMACVLGDRQPQLSKPQRFASYSAIELVSLRLREGWRLVEPRSGAF
jgi:hypothetical protein